jgi:hypothetical protein
MNAARQENSRTSLSIPVMLAPLRKIISTSRGLDVGPVADSANRKGPRPRLDGDIARKVQAIIATRDNAHTRRDTRRARMMVLTRRQRTGRELSITAVNGT